MDAGERGASSGETALSAGLADALADAEGAALLDAIGGALTAALADVDTSVPVAPGREQPAVNSSSTTPHRDAADMTTPMPSRVT